MSDRVISSAVEHCLHTAGVTCSIHVSPTRFRQISDLHLSRAPCQGAFFCRPWRCGGTFGRLLSCVSPSGSGVPGLPSTGPALCRANPAMTMCDVLLRCGLSYTHAHLAWKRTVDGHERAGKPCQAHSGACLACGQALNSPNLQQEIPPHPAPVRVDERPSP